MGIIKWINKKENAIDTAIAGILLFDLILVNLLFSFFTSFMNHPARDFSWFELWVVLPIGVTIVPLLLIALIVFQIKLTREGTIQKLFHIQ